MSRTALALLIDFVRLLGFGLRFRTRLAAGPPRDYLLAG
jgi:hypothetical protein